MPKPKINRKCVAASYESPSEAIVEVTHELGGCLISVRPQGDRLIIDVYRADDSIIVLAGNSLKPKTIRPAREES
jgi:hypothetical protein